MRPLALAIGATLLLLGCLDVGGKLDTPVSGGNGGSLGDGTSGALGGSDAGSNGAGGTFSCDHHTIDSTCTGYPTGTTQSDAEASCDGTLQSSPCSAVAVVGRCLLGGQTDFYYSDGATPRNAADSKANCQIVGGTFSN